MEGDMGNTGGLINPRPWHGRCRAGYLNTGGPPLPRKRAPCQKKWTAGILFYVLTASKLSQSLIDDARFFIFQSSKLMLWSKTQNIVKFCTFGEGPPIFSIFDPYSLVALFIKYPPMQQTVWYVFVVSWRNKLMVQTRLSGCHSSHSSRYNNIRGKNTFHITYIHIFGSKPTIASEQTVAIGILFFSRIFKPDSIRACVRACVRAYVRTSICTSYCSISGCFILESALVIHCWLFPGLSLHIPEVHYNGTPGTEQLKKQHI